VFEQIYCTIFYILEIWDEKSGTNC